MPETNFKIIKNPPQNAEGNENTCSLFELQHAGIVIRRCFEAQQFNAGRRQRTDPKSGTKFSRIFAFAFRIVDDTGNRIERMTGLTGNLSFRIYLDLTVFTVFKHVVSITVIRRNDQNSAGSMIRNEKMSKKEESA